MNLLGILFLIIWLGLIAIGLPGLMRMTRLSLPVERRPTEAPAGGWPRVSIIVTACNEERTIAMGLRSLLAIDYPHLEIIAINDRSTDQTGAVMKETARDHPTLTIMEITDLPPGWLGKNHALAKGAANATGEWLLFTDADVVLHPLALKTAINHAVSQQLDHLAAAPLMKAKGVLLQGLVFLFMFNLMIFFRPQYAKSPHSHAHMGVGAFNLLKKSVYQAVGGHKPIRMRPDDDLKLGRMIKHKGYRQDFAFAEELLEVEWYPSIREMMRGLEKNTLAPFEYRIPILMTGLMPLGAFYLLPFIGIVVAEGWGRAIYAVMLIASLLYFCLHGRMSWRMVGYYALFPITVPLLLYALARAAWLTWRRGGIMWRGTLYPIEWLKQK
ncbi:UNVERIFIED_CONTAM: glycosyltransferase involved in cell wall biosynthesis [Brevibacillus sp. OAP136]